VPLQEALYCAIDKVYSMQSSRRAYSRYKEAENTAQISKAPNYNVINILLNDPEITPILNKLLHITALPLKSAESKFSVDSTGFRTTQFNEYCKDKHDTKRKHKWIKCHALTGNTTNIIVSAIITAENGADSPQLIPLLKESANLGFDMQELSGDKAYNSIDNYNAIKEVGAIGFLPFKNNITATSKTGNRARLWRRMFYYFHLNQEQFLTHYHARSNIESTFMAIKFKFGDCLKNKNFTSQTNELLCKLIAYNLSVLIGAMYELKIEPVLALNKGC
jgi:transposase